MAVWKGTSIFKLATSCSLNTTSAPSWRLSKCIDICGKLLPPIILHEALFTCPSYQQGKYRHVSIAENKDISAFQINFRISRKCTHPRKSNDWIVHEHFSITDNFFVKIGTHLNLQWKYWKIDVFIESINTYHLVLKGII